jgi:3-hydroxy-3-methylglutaryl CoA synthase/uncharacterized OB-fold protein
VCVRGIFALGGYVPFRRLDRRAIAAVAGAGGGSGTRSVASYDEDTTTMGFEAARNALRASRGPVRSLWFATTAPAYADRTNATAVHAALRLDRDVVAADAAGAVRSSVAAVRGALLSTEPVLVVASDLRTGLPGSADEAASGDGAAAIAIGDDTDAEVLVEYLGGGSATEEFLDRWRAPGEVRSRMWEERFGEGRYTALGEEAWERALKATGVTEVDHLVVVSTHARAAATLSKRLAGPATTVADTLGATVGHTGAAHPLLVLTHVLEDQARVGQVVALVSLADGADVLLFRVRHPPQPVRSVTAQVAAGGPISYGKYLSWRGLLTVEPPRRPEPARVSASAAGRSVEWKFGFVGSREKTTGDVRMPPAVPGADPGEEWEPAPMADAQGTVATYTIDRLAYSPSPPVMFAVVDFDGGGRLPVELADADADEVAVGMRVEPTFRRLSTADGIHNYFWKARPVRA